MEPERMAVAGVIIVVVVVGHHPLAQLVAVEVGRRLELCDRSTKVDDADQQLRQSSRPHRSKQAGAGGIGTAPEL